MTTRTITLRAEHWQAIKNTLLNLCVDDPYVSPEASDACDALDAALAQPEEWLTDEELITLDELKSLWNAQADPANDWDELGIDEILLFAQQQVLGWWGRPISVPEPEVPTDYIDAGHTGGQDREMLEVFYLASQSEGGTADEIHLRGLKAVLARWGRPAIKPVPAGRPWPVPGDAEGLAEVFWGNYDQFEPEWSSEIEPVPVGDRWPEFSDCDQCERVWAWNPVLEHWKLTRLNRSIHTHWLPHYALPVPTSQEP